MLIALLVDYLLYGSSSGADPMIHYIEQLKHAVKADIVAGDQRELALSVIDELEQATKANSEKVDKARKSLDQLLTGKRLVARSEFTSVLGELETLRTGHQDQILHLRAKLKKDLDRAMWQKIFAAGDQTSKNVH